MSDAMLISQIIRLLVIVGGTVALILLLRAKKQKWNMWTEKMRDYYVVILLFTAGAVEGNLEYLYRGTDLTGGTIIGVAAITVALRAATRKGGYTKDE